VNNHKPLDLRGLIANSILEYAIEVYGRFDDSFAFYNAWLFDVARKRGYPMGDSENFEFAIAIISSCIHAPLNLLKIDQEVERMFDSRILGELNFRNGRGNNNGEDLHY